MHVQKVGAVILAGGRSSRMGRPKELLEWRGGTLIGQLAKEAIALGLPVLVVTNDPDRLPGEVAGSPQVGVTRDLVPSAGPVSGIVTAFRSRPEEMLLVLSCDLPFADRKQMSRLLEYASACEEWDAVVAQEEGRLHPLFALYHRRSQPVWEQALRRGQLRVMEALSQIRVAKTPDGWLDPWATFNANTPEDYRRAVAEQQRRDAGER